MFLFLSLSSVCVCVCHFIKDKVFLTGLITKTNSINSKMTIEKK